MKTKHGILKAKTRSVLAGFAVLLMAAIFSLSSCGDGAGDNSDGGGGTVTIKISGLPTDTTYYIGPAWKTGSITSASGYHPKFGVTDSKGVVTVSYTSDNIKNVWGNDDCYIFYHTGEFILEGKKSKSTYKMESKTIELSANSDF
jgi:hypothetical protein